MSWFFFILGCFVGACIGSLMTAVCVAGKVRLRGSKSGHTKADTQSQFKAAASDSFSSARLFKVIEGLFKSP
jgi:hypothetical protein